MEIAVGDRLRIGATQWEKQLFNGTIVTVEDFKVLRVQWRKDAGVDLVKDPEPMRPLA